MNKEHYETVPKPTMDMRCQDGNIFSIIGKAARILRDEGLRDEAKEMSQKVMKSSSYSEALSIISQYINFDYDTE
jgi:hypothetical protein